MKTGANGQVTRVRDIARVELAARDYTVNSGLGGKPATAIAIFQLPGSNALATSDAVRKKMAELKQRFPAGLDYTIVYDPTVSVRESIHEVQKTLFEAIALVVLVVLVFLQTWRAAIIPLIAIPVSLIGTFAAMLAFGFSINNVSLFGIVLAIGIVVDDAIVVVEAIEHHIERRSEPARRGAKSHDRGRRSISRDCARPLLGLYPDRVHCWHHRTIFSPIRAHYCGLDRDLALSIRSRFHPRSPPSCFGRVARRRIYFSVCSTACSAGSSKVSTNSSPGARTPTATRSRGLPDWRLSFSCSTPVCLA